MTSNSRKYFLVGATIQVELRFIGELCDMMRGLSTSSAPYSLAKAQRLHLPTMANSAAFRETTTSHHDRLSMQCRSRPQCDVLNVVPVCSDFLLLPPELHRQLLLYQQMRYVYVPTHVHHIHFLFLQTVNNPVCTLPR
jgi:hypothetical protein